MTSIEELFAKRFPYKKPNPGQKEAILKTVEAFRSGKKHVVLGAPTGLGKSSIAVTVHRILREIQDGSFRTTITTATKNLQDQYTGEFKEIHDLRGKTNYDCPKNVGPYNSPKCRNLIVESNCTPSQQCPYYKQRKKWTDQAVIRITNTSFQIEACAMLVMTPETRADMIVIDECHNIDEHLVAHSTLKLDVDALQSLKKVVGVNAISGVVDFINDFISVQVGSVVSVNDEYGNKATAISDHFESLMESLQIKLKTATHGKDSIAGAIEEMQQIADKLRQFSETHGEWILTEYVYAHKIELRPIYAHQVSEFGLFRKSDRFLHMSATICGHDAYIKSLGIKREECEFIDLANPIPVENRLVRSLSAIKVSGDYDRVRLAELVDKIIDRHPNQNGIIHTVSFALAEDIVKYSKNKKKMLVSNNRDEIVSRLMKFNSGTVILSPSIEQGYDFPGDMSRFQIIAKVPFLALGDPHTKLNLERHPEWYARKAILRLVQASGRSVRGVDDFASTYIIDSNLDMLIRRNRDLFPSWYLDSLVGNRK
jgi:Rad3-related DNA helicase